MNLSKTDLELLKTFFISKPVKRAFVFGSYSRGQADADSDIDILVELDYSKHIGLGFITMKHEIEDALRKSVDLVSQQSVSKHLLPLIDQDKLLIYENA